MSGEGATAARETGGEGLLIMVPKRWMVRREGLTEGWGDGGMGHGVIYTDDLKMGQKETTK